MYHSITFGEKNTWNDWKLVPTSRPVIAPPEPKTNYVEIPGSNNIIDLSETLTGRTTYKYREGSIEFYVADKKTPWYKIYADVMNYLHGQHMKMILEDDRIHYYVGRFAVDEWASEEQNSTITISYHVYPYKYDTFTSAGDWLWNPFSFVDGIAVNLADMRVDGELIRIIPGSIMPVIPTIRAKIDDGEMMIMQFDGKIYDIKNGTNNNLDIVIDSHEHKVVFNGYGTASVIYRGGSL